MTQLYPLAPGSLFIAFYDSQGYGGGILTHLRMGYIVVIERVINAPNIYQDSLFYYSMLVIKHLWRISFRTGCSKPQYGRVSLTLLAVSFLFPASYCQCNRVLSR
jgi:hypothetical protein